MFIIIIFILSLCDLQSSQLYKKEYNSQTPRTAEEVINQLKHEPGWSARHNAFVRQIAEDPAGPAGWAKRYDGRSIKPILSGAPKIFHKIFDTIFSAATAGVFNNSDDDDENNSDDGSDYACSAIHAATPHVLRRPQLGVCSLVAEENRKEDRQRKDALLSRCAQVMITYPIGYHSRRGTYSAKKQEKPAERIARIRAESAASTTLFPIPRGGALNNSDDGCAPAQLAELTNNTSSQLYPLCQLALEDENYSDTGSDYECSAIHSARQQHVLRAAEEKAGLVLAQARKRAAIIIDDAKYAARMMQEDAIMMLELARQEAAQLRTPKPGISADGNAASSVFYAPAVPTYRKPNEAKSALKVFDQIRQAKGASADAAKAGDEARLKSKRRNNHPTTQRAQLCAAIQQTKRASTGAAKAGDEARLKSKTRQRTPTTQRELLCAEIQKKAGSSAHAATAGDAARLASKARQASILAANQQDSVLVGILRNLRAKINGHDGSDSDNDSEDGNGIDNDWS